MSWLAVKLAALLRRIERAAAAGAQPSGDSARRELRYLEQRLARLDDDEAALGGMLAAARDSFHHSLAAGTTAHEASLGDRRRALEARIANLRSTLEDDAT